MKNRFFLFCVASVLFSALSGFAAEVPLTWSPSVSTNVQGYFIYAFTNAVFNATNKPAIKVDAGTNLVARVDGLTPGLWTFAATAYNTQKVESDFSNTVTTEVLPAPGQMRILTVQYDATLTTTNWQDVGFFRLKIR